jgi:hypothetical protein
MGNGTGGRPWDAAGRATSEVALIVRRSIAEIAEA